MEDYITIGVLHGQRGPFTYRCPTDIAEDLEEGDVVAVKNRFGFSAGEVIDIHDTKEDTDPSIHYRWAFQKLDTSRAEELDPDD